MLVIGSGAGMGLLHLHQTGRPHSITAVELDPLVASLMANGAGEWAKYNGRIFDHVTALYGGMDGRAFLESSTIDSSIHSSSTVRGAVHINHSLNQSFTQ